MDKKNKIVEILESWEKDNGHYFNSIKESDYQNISDEIVKLFAIPVVVLSDCDYGHNTLNKNDKPCKLMCCVKKEDYEQ